MLIDEQAVHALVRFFFDYVTLSYVGACKSYASYEFHLRGAEGNIRWLITYWNDKYQIDVTQM